MVQVCVCRYQSVLRIMSRGRSISAFPGRERRRGDPVPKPGTHPAFNGRPGEAPEKIRELLSAPQVTGPCRACVLTYHQPCGTIQVIGGTTGLILGQWQQCISPDLIKGISTWWTGSVRDPRLAAELSPPKSWRGDLSCLMQAD